MKKITLLIALMITSLGFAQVPTVNFETNGLSFIKGTGGGNVATIGTGIGTNTTQVANLAKGPEQYQAFEITLTNEVSFAVNGAKTITFDFYQATATVRPILVKFEGGSIDPVANNGYEVEINTAAVAGWQTLSFNFGNARESYPNSGTNKNLVGSYKRMFIFIDFGLAPPSNTAIDNVGGGTQGVAQTPPITSFNLTFETPTSNTILNCFDGAEYTDGVTNDVTTGINTSAKAGQIAKINASLYANMQYKIPEGINLSSGGKGFSVMVKGPRAIPVKFKLEGGAQVEKDVNYTTPGVWQKLVFDFSGDTSTNHNLIVLFLEITAGPSANPANDVFLVDNIVLGTVSSLSTTKFDKSTVKMYPNPVQNTLTIEANSEIQRVSVFNVLGQEVMSRSPKSNSTTLQTNDLQKGVYMVTTEIDGNISSSKIVKE
jgi:Secretion system C-terminal sorting domain